MTTAPARTNGNDGTALMEQVVIRGDLSKLAPVERANYYTAVCRSVGLNPLTKPFEYITLNGKLTLYALRNCTDQLRAIHKVSVVEMTEAERDGVCIITCMVQTPDGRTDMAKGAVHLGNLKGEALANAIMKAETKAKRRATLSICGLSLLDETEVEDIPRRDNPHVNRPEDIVDVPAEDDPDRLPAGNPEIKALPKKNARADFEIWQRELHATKTVAQCKDWMAGQADRVQTYPEDWRDIARGLCTQHLASLRAKETPDLGPHNPAANATPEPEGDPLDALTDAYSACETAAAMWEIDQKMYIPFVQSASPDDRERANDIRQEHLDRIEGATQ